jgi:hypothetical protein
VKARVWKDHGLWQWEVRDERFQCVRLTGGSRRDWGEALRRALRGLKWLAQG